MQQIVSRTGFRRKRPTQFVILAGNAQILTWDHILGLSLDGCALPARAAYAARVMETVRVVWRALAIQSSTVSSGWRSPFPGTAPPDPDGDSSLAGRSTSASPPRNKPGQPSSRISEVLQDR